MGIRDRLTKRSSHISAQMAPASIRPQSAMEHYVSQQLKETFNSIRELKPFESAIRLETRYERRKRK